MRGFLKFVTRTRTRAVAVTVASLLLPPFSFIAGGIVGLVTLRYGVGDGALVLASSVAVAAACTLVVLNTADPMLIFVIFTGLPALLLTGVLRATGSQGLALASAGLAAGIATSGVHLLAADPIAWWRGVLGRFLLDRTAGRQPPPDPEVLERMNELVDALAPLMTSLPTGAVVAAMLVMFLARWWHSLLDNPGGFGREFRELRLDRRVAVVTVGIALFALFGRDAAGGLGPELFQLVIVLYTLQGLALAHSLVVARGAAGGWLGALYVLLVLLPPSVIVVLSAAGFSDTWVDYRRRWGTV